MKYEPAKTIREKSTELADLCVDKLGLSRIKQSDPFFEEARETAISVVQNDYSKDLSDAAEDILFRRALISALYNSLQSRIDPLLEIKEFEPTRNKIFAYAAPSSDSPNKWLDIDQWDLKGFEQKSERGQLAVIGYVAKSIAIQDEEIQKVEGKIKKRG